MANGRGLRWAVADGRDGACQSIVAEERSVESLECWTTHVSGKLEKGGVHREVNYETVLSRQPRSNLAFPEHPRRQRREHRWRKP